jgi:surfactin synthase thioesterase subunit
MLDNHMRKLVCFPFAGAGSSFFRPWATAMGALFQVTAVQLPGRENRFSEAPYRNVEQAILDLEPEIEGLVDGASEIVVFGHSLGAVLAYELALRLNRSPAAAISRLVVSGSPGPSRPRARRASGLSDKEFLAQVRDLAGYSHPSLEDPEMRELLLPVLRADVEMHEAYSSNGKSQLDMPVTSIRGRDDELVSAQETADWQEVTRVPLEKIELDGGHMYLADHPEQLFRLLGRCTAVA